MSDDLTKKLSYSADEKLAMILFRLDSLEQKVDERLYDTRPIWQKLVDDITQLQKGQETVITDCEEIKMSIRDIYSRFEILSESIIGTQVRNRDLERRVKVLESNSNPTNSQT
jgi:hypothetical protein